MAKCDLCGSNCKASEMKQLRNSYRVEDVEDLCQKCSDWADDLKDALMDEIPLKLRTAIEARLHGGQIKRPGFWDRFKIAL